MDKLRRVMIALTTFVFVTLMLIISAVAYTPQADPAAFYSSKCVTCHGKKAEKKFDTGLPDEQLVEAVLKGKKPEKPPNMPAYGDKGVTAEQAKALVDYMKQLKTQ